jgi:hypothetical protein
MPYLNCPDCRLTVYSSAFYSTTDECPRCTAKLGRPSRLFRSQVPPRLAAAPQLPTPADGSATRSDRSAQAG